MIYPSFMITKFMTFAGCIILFVPASIDAGVAISSGEAIDFTTLIFGDKRVSYTPAFRLSLTKEGLGWEGASSNSIEASVTLAPIAIGLNWRPARGAYLACTLSPAPVGWTHSGGVVNPSVTGRCFVRYSPDKLHWSTWQLLGDGLPKASTGGLLFSGHLAVSRIAAERYDQLLRSYSKLDVPWTSNEEAAVKWILAKEPDFFAKELPFVGYVQARWEGSLFGGQRLKTFDLRINVGISGLHTPPKDQKYPRQEGVWQFDATSK